MNKITKLILIVSSILINTALAEVQQPVTVAVNAAELVPCNFIIQGNFNKVPQDATQLDDFITKYSKAIEDWQTQLKSPDLDIISLLNASGSPTAKQLFDLHNALNTASQAYEKSEKEFWTCFDATNNNHLTCGDKNLAFANAINNYTIALAKLLRFFIAQGAAIDNLIVQSIPLTVDNVPVKDKAGNALSTNTVANWDWTRDEDKFNAAYFKVIKDSFINILKPCSEKIAEIINTVQKVLEEIDAKAVTAANREKFFKQGESLLPGQHISNNNSYLIYQTDGNLVLYPGTGPQDNKGTALWTSNTQGTKPGKVTQVADGNVAIYDADGKLIWVSRPGKTATSSTGIFFAAVNGANFATYKDGVDISDPKAIPLWWARPTVSPSLRQLNRGKFLNQGEYLLAGEFISNNNSYLLYQTDGNLALYPGAGPQDNKGAALWHSNTQGTKPGKVTQVADGNVAIYDADGKLIWVSRPGKTATSSTGIFFAAVNGTNFVTYTDGTNIYDSNAKALWSAIPSASTSLRTTADVAQSTAFGLTACDFLNEYNVDLSNSSPSALGSFAEKFQKAVQDWQNKLETDQAYALKLLTSSTVTKELFDLYEKLKKSVEAYDSAEKNFKACDRSKTNCTPKDEALIATLNVVGEDQFKIMKFLAEKGFSEEPQKDTNEFLIGGKQPVKDSQGNTLAIVGVKNWDNDKFQKGLDDFITNAFTNMIAACTDKIAEIADRLQARADVLQGMGEAAMITTYGAAGGLISIPIIISAAKETKALKGVARAGAMSGTIVKNLLKAGGAMGISMLAAYLLPSRTVITKTLDLVMNWAAEQFLSAIEDVKNAADKCGSGGQAGAAAGGAVLGAGGAVAGAAIGAAASGGDVSSCMLMIGQAMKAASLFVVQVLADELRDAAIVGENLAFMVFDEGARREIGAKLIYSWGGKEASEAFATLGREYSLANAGKSLAEELIKIPGMESAASAIGGVLGFGPVSEPVYYVCYARNYNKINKDLGDVFKVDYKQVDSVDKNTVLAGCKKLFEDQKLKDQCFDKLFVAKIPESSASYNKDLLARGGLGSDLFQIGAVWNPLLTSPGMWFNTTNFDEFLNTKSSMYPANMPANLEFDYLGNSKKGGEISVTV